MQQILPRCRGRMGHHLTASALPYPLNARSITRPRIRGGYGRRVDLQGESGATSTSLLILTSSAVCVALGLGVCVLSLCFYNQNCRRSTSDPRRTTLVVFVDHFNLVPLLFRPFFLLIYGKYRVHLKF